MTTKTNTNSNRRPKQLPLISGGGLSFNVVAALRDLRTTIDSVPEHEWRVRQDRWRGLNEDAEGRIERS